MAKRAVTINFDVDTDNYHELDEDGSVESVISFVKDMLHGLGASFPEEGCTIECDGVLVPYNP